MVSSSLLGMVLLFRLGFGQLPRLSVLLLVLLSVTVEQFLTRAGPAHVFKILTNVVVHGVYSMESIIWSKSDSL